MGDYDVHKCELFEFTPAAIQCMAAYEFPKASEKCIGLLAVGRENGSIEVYRHTEGGFHCYLKIPGSSDIHLQDLCFYNGRLFSAQLEGVICEYSLTSGSRLYFEESYGGAVWCLDVANGIGKLATGCEDGSLKLFGCSGERLEFEKNMLGQEERILCCSFHPNNKYIASGSINVIRIWHCEKGHSVHRIRLDEGMKENLIWRVKMLSDSTVISGDSKGNICFWDMKNETQSQSFRIHKSGVLALCVSQDESTVYAAGIDPRLVSLNRTAEKTSDTPTPLGMEPSPDPEVTWVKGITRHDHSHDVRALTIVGKYLTSGGVDTRIFVQDTTNLRRVKTKSIAPFPHDNRCHFASDAELVLLQYPRYLDIWRLGATGNTPGTIVDGDRVPLDEPPVKICQIKLQSRNHDDISCSAISINGKWVAYGTCSTFKLLWLNCKDEESEDIAITKIPTPWVNSLIAVSFCPGSKHVVVSAHSSFIYVLNLHSSGRVHLKHVIKPEGPPNPAVKITCNSSYTATLDLTDRIKVYSLDEPDLKCTLPNNTCYPTAFAFKPSSNCLFVAYHDHSVIEYNVEKESYTEWCKQAVKAGFNLALYSGQFSAKTKALHSWKTSPITRISFTNAELQKVVFISHEEVYFMPYSTDVFRTAESSHGKDRKRKSPVHSVKKYSAFRHNLLFEFFRNDSSIISVERQWEDISSQLPEALYLKKFAR